MSVALANTTVNLSGKTAVLAEADQSITGLQTFARGASAPFAVPAGAAKVANLDADKLDGYDSAAFQTRIALSNQQGLTTNPLAENFAQCAVAPQVFQTLTLEMELHYFPGAAPSLQLMYAPTTGPQVALLRFDTLVPGSQIYTARVHLRRATPAAGDVGMQVLCTLVTEAGTKLAGGFQGITSWTTPWLLMLQHGGVPAGDSLYWKWSVTLATNSGLP